MSHSNIFFAQDTARQSVAEIEVQPPAMMLGEGLCGEWDSSMEADQSLELMDRAELTRLFNQFSA
jgi:hypothetical protein